MDQNIQNIVCIYIIQEILGLLTLLYYFFFVFVLVSWTIYHYDAFRRRL